MKNATMWMMTALAIGTMTGCDAVRAQTQVRGVDVLQADGVAKETTEESCPGCRRKWTAKPDGGVNGPPWSI